MSRTSSNTRKIPLIEKVYGIYCLLSGGLVLVMATFLGGLLATGNAGDLIANSHNTNLTVILAIVQIVIMLAMCVGNVALGVAMLRNRRRHVAQAAYALIALNIAGTVVEIMLRGIGENLVSGFVQLVILIAISVTVDPTLKEERRRERLARNAELEREAREGTLGRAKGDRGFIELDFFNLFWVFVVCCVLGLIIETIYHMVVVEPGVYQDRAGLLFGPFSPIYGFGAVLMTVALNRFYKANFLVIFAVSAVIGGAFEAATAWFMETAFGAVAWNYSDATIFGLVADPIAQLTGGGTCLLFMAMWGVLGMVWIKLCLPALLKFINLIPWRSRYAVTAVCTALMLVNGVMTLEALDCWYERLSGVEPQSPVERFYARDFDNDYMQKRFQSMDITPEKTARTDVPKDA